MDFNSQWPKNEYHFRLGTGEYILAEVSYNNKLNNERVAKVTYEIDNAIELGFDPNTKTLDVIVTDLSANKKRRKIRRAIATEAGLRRMGIRPKGSQLGKGK